MPESTSGWLEVIVARWRWFWGLRAPVDTDTDQRGRAGEEAAALFVQKQGWKIVARNWRHGRDELDLVAWDGAVLVFAEVRTRKQQALVPGYHSVTGRKKRALGRAVRAYLQGMPSRPANFRFDIVEVKVSDSAPAEILLHSGIPLLPNNAPSGRRL